MNELKACLIFSHAPQISKSQAKRLVDHFGSGLLALSAIQSDKPLPLSLKEESITYLKTVDMQKGWQEDLDFAIRVNISLIPYTSDCFPQRLKILADCPLILYVRGTLPDQANMSIGIIGTRKATFYGLEMAKRYASHLAKANAVIVSGLAKGVDTEAHIGTLPMSGKTSAIIGSGLLCLYPKENSRLADEIINNNGSIISELPMTCPPTRFTFPKRNRLIAAMSDALLLIEAPEKSGAMIAMEMAAKQKKPLFALTSHEISETFAGNRLLIDRQIAKPVAHPDEILKILQSAL